jgi:tetratricopeptide (TPR) repeat protein
MYAFRISITPWRAVFWGRRSMNLINKALETDPANPSAWIEHGNAMFYAPAALGGSKEEAVNSYSRAATLLEAGMMENQRWLYLNTLVGLARSYSETGNRSMARITYLKALEFEPEFKWVKDKLLPQLMKE